MTTFLHEADLPADALLGAEAVAIDSETMGLRLGRDPLCVVQLSDGKGDAHVVQLARPGYDAPNLKRLLTDPKVVKIFHFGRFDIAMFYLHLGVVTAPVYCTKIASKLARTYTDRHGLKDITKELKPGLNKIIAQARKKYENPNAPKSQSRTHVMRVIIGEGRTTKDQVTIDKQVMTFTRTAADTNDVTQEYSFTTR